MHQTNAYGPRWANRFGPPGRDVANANARLDANDDGDSRPRDTCAGAHATYCVC